METISEELGGSEFDLTVSSEPPRSIVADNFYSRPCDVREHALTGTWQKEESSGFPGLRAPAPLNLGMADRIASLVGRDLWNFRSSLQYTTAADRCFVHRDSTDWAGVIYLDSDHDGVAGTSFYRHIATGLEELTANFELMQACIRLGCGVQDIVDLVTLDRYDLDKWELTYSIPFKFNRLVTYRASFFHMNASTWGTDALTGRLVEAIFFQVSDARDAAAGPFKAVPATVESLAAEKAEKSKPRVSPRTSDRESTL